MTRHRVVVTDQVFASVELERNLLAEIDADVDVADGTVTGLLAQGRDADALLNTYLPIDRATIGHLTRCRVIARYGIGVDNIDLRAASEAGIVVTNVPDYCIEEVAAHALALILTLVRRINEADLFVKGGGWGTASLRPVHRLSEQTVGLIGFGKIARRLAEHLKSLGARIIAFDPYATPGPGDPPFVSLEELLATASIVSIHAPLTDETRGLVAASTLATMRADAILVNTSRGPLVDLADLVEALRNGRIRAAALDVLDHEPPPAEYLAAVPGLLVTPHMAYYSEEAERESQRKAATQVIKVLTGREPDYPVSV